MRKMSKLDKLKSFATLPSPSTTANPPPHHENSTKTLFKNPWPSAQALSYSELYTLTTTAGFPLSWYANAPHSSAPTPDLEVVKPDWGLGDLVAKAKKGVSREDCVVGTWLGHASVLVSIPLQGGSANEKEGGRTFNILYDPIFSPRAGPTPNTGPLRLLPPPCPVEDLPGVDMVCLSHNHYDHTDFPTIEKVIKKWPDAKWCIPLGMEEWLLSSGGSKDNIFEGDWWDHTEFIPDGGEGKLKLTCVPAQHNSGRAIVDKDHTLWCGWVVEHFIPSAGGKDLEDTPYTRKSAVYHAGDTGYRRFSPSILPASSTTNPENAIPNPPCPIFPEIRRHFASAKDPLATEPPFDLAFLPIWRGGTLSFFSAVGVRLSNNGLPTAGHATPDDAVQIHKEIGSKLSIAIHWGTFVGNADEGREARCEFRGSVEKEGITWICPEDAEEEDNGGKGPGKAGVVNIGQSVVVEVGR